VQQKVEEEVEERRVRCRVRRTNATLENFAPGLPATGAADLDPNLSQLTGLFFSTLYSYSYS